MEITKDKVARKLLSYLQHKCSLDELVDWAENVLINEALKQGDEETLREVIGRLGLADVKQFGLSWEDCELLMKNLGYKIKVDATAA
jgi:hypothetical protein